MPDAAITICRCDPQSDHSALRLAARAWPEAERSAYWEAIRWLLASQATDRVALVAAKSGDRLVAGQLAQVLPGKVALIWPPVFADGNCTADSALIASLFDATVAALSGSGADLAQSLTACDDNMARTVFVAGRFEQAAELLYLSAETADLPEMNDPLPFELEPFNPAGIARLASLIERTYVGTLDCPRIDGLRKTADVIDGYQAVGRFRPELWFFVRDRDEDVGCLLLNIHPDVAHMEIVYLALMPSVRGRGWGRQLARAALEKSRQHQCSRVVLAVDSVNSPAIRMYEQVGFAIFDRRCVWIRTLAKN